MLRTILIAAILASTPFAQAGTVASCDALDAQRNGRSVQFDGTDVDLDGEDLVLRSGGVELIHIDAKRNLFISGRPVAVPDASRPALDAYVAGFRALRGTAASLGTEGARIAAKAVAGLVDVLFTSTTIDDYERNMEAQGARIEATADSLCRTIAALQRTELELQQRIPAFPTFIAPSNPAL